jgi:hypothetical protein
MDNPFDTILDEIHQLRAEIAELRAERKQPEERLLSTEEACKMFQPEISRQTLISWVKRDFIAMQKIRSKNYFKLSDLMNAGQKLKKYKRQ